MNEPRHDYDPAEALGSAEAIEVLMADALETGDAAYIARAMAVAEQARLRLLGPVEPSSACLLVIQ